MTIDELAQAASITARNVRAYQDRGLLPPPQKLGRTGYYGTQHLARLRVISRLLRRGYSLQSIGDLFRTWEDGRSLSDVLGFEEAMVGGGPDRRNRISAADLGEWFADVNPGDLDRAVALGVLVPDPDGDGYEVPNQQIVETGRALAEAGYRVGDLLEETLRLQHDVEAIAKRWLDVWKRNVWDPYVEAGCPPERLRDITAAMSRIRDVPGLAASALLSAAMQAESDARMAEILETNQQRAEGTTSRPRPRRS